MSGRKQLPKEVIEKCRQIAQEHNASFLLLTDLRVAHSDMSGTGRTSIYDKFPVKSQRVYYFSRYDFQASQSSVRSY